jgi:hypothetical protein
MRISKENPDQDKLSRFANWYLNSGNIKAVHTPSGKNALLFIEGVHGITLYRSKPYQVELFICQPNLNIPEHTHPNVDSYEVFLYGMNFTHGGKTVISKEQSLEETNGLPTYAYEAIRVRPNDLHGGTASEHGGSFISIQHWLNDVDPTHVSSDWDGNFMGTNHSKQVVHKQDSRPRGKCESGDPESVQWGRKHGEQGRVSNAY